MTVRVYRSTDASAPSLTGNNGSLITLLDACLVNGYGTFTSSGWTKPYTGTNVASYQMPSGNLRWFRIDDSVGLYARIVGYENMTDVNTGTNPFPTPAQQSGGGYIIKSTNTSTPIPWVLVATETMVYLWINYTNELKNVIPAHMYCFGDILSYMAGDNYNTVLIAQTSSSSTLCSMSSVVLNYTSASTGSWICRSYNGVIGAVAVGKSVDRAKNDNTTAIGAPSVNIRQYVTSTPSLVNQSITFTPIMIYEPAITSTPFIARGMLPGLWNLNNSNVNIFRYNQNSGPTISITSGINTGKVFELITCGNYGVVWIETSNTW
jgi:hypothetical protein